MSTAPEPTGKNVLSLAWPMTLKAIFLHGIVVIDGLMIAPLGENAIAAIGIAAAFGGITLGFIFAFAHAMQIRAAQAFGRGDKVFQKSVLVAGLTVSIIIGIFCAAIILLLGKSITAAFAPSEQVASDAWAYLQIFSLVIIGQGVAHSIITHFNGCGRTKIPLIGYCFSVPINIISSYTLIYGLWGMPQMGVAGAALGSVIGVAAQAAYLLVKLQQTDGHLRTVLGWRNGTFANTLKRHSIFASPIAATFVSANFSSHVCVLIYANMPLPAFAALALIAPWNMVAGQISMQWTQATGIIVAQLLGRRTDKTVLDKFLRSAWHGAFVAATIVALIFLIMCFSVDVIYPSLEEETRAILFEFLPLLLLIQPFRATNAICGNTLRASGDTIYVMQLFLWSQWAFRVPMTALFVLYWDLSAFCVLGLILAEELIKFPAFHRRLFQGQWKTAAVE